MADKKAVGKSRPIKAAKEKVAKPVKAAVQIAVRKKKVISAPEKPHTLSEQLRAVTQTDLEQVPLPVLPPRELVLPEPILPIEFMAKVKKGDLLVIKDIDENGVYHNRGAEVMVNDNIKVTVHVYMLYQPTRSFSLIVRRGEIVNADINKPVDVRFANTKESISILKNKERPEAGTIASIIGFVEGVMVGVAYPKHEDVEKGTFFGVVEHVKEGGLKVHFYYGGKDGNEVNTLRRNEKGQWRDVTYRAPVTEIRTLTASESRTLEQNMKKSGVQIKQGPARATKAVRERLDARSGKVHVYKQGGKAVNKVVSSKRKRRAV
jgi:hypothetical protein